MLGVSTRLVLSGTLTRVFSSYVCCIGISQRKVKETKGGWIVWKGNWKIVLCRSNASSLSLANKQRCSRHHLAAEAGRRGFEVQPVPDSHWSIFLDSYWSRAYLRAEVADRGKKRRLTWHQARADGFVWKEKSWQTHGRKCVLSKLKNDNKSPHFQRQRCHQQIV